MDRRPMRRGALALLLLFGGASCSSTSTNEPNQVGGSAGMGSDGGGTGGGAGSCTNCYASLYECKTPCQGPAATLYDTLLACACAPGGKCSTTCSPSECAAPCGVVQSSPCDTCIYTQCAGEATACEQDNK